MKLKTSDPMRMFFVRLGIILLPGLAIVLILRRVHSLNSMVLGSKIIDFFYKLIMVCSEFFLKILGFDTTLVYSDKIYYYPVYAIQIGKGGYVFMGISCLGILLMGAFAALIIAYPGNWKHKLWFIPLGFFIIQVLNVIRMSLLTILFSYYGVNVVKVYPVFGLVYLNHHDIFNIAVYILIFFMFTFYVNHYGAKKLKEIK